MHNSTLINIMNHTNFTCVGNNNKYTPPHKKNNKFPNDSMDNDWQKVPENKNNKTKICKTQKMVPEKKPKNATRDFNTPEKKISVESEVNPNVTKENAYQMIFPNPWNIWIHKNSSGDWTLSGYDNIMTINNVGDFWSFMNTFNKINYMDYQFFVMRGNIPPIWEAAENRNGGAASIRLRLSDKNLLNIWEDICAYTVNEQICNCANDINGVSFNLKNDLTVVKIWNRDSNNDISKKITSCLVNKYKLRSILYIKNRPDY